MKSDFYSKARSYWACKLAHWNRMRHQPIELKDSSQNFSRNIDNGNCRKNWVFRKVALKVRKLFGNGPFCPEKLSLIFYGLNIKFKFSFWVQHRQQPIGAFV